MKLARLRAHLRLNACLFHTLYKTTYGAVSIRDQKTRWEVAHRNSLSFNYHSHSQSELADYIIVHELCHLLAQSFPALLGAGMSASNHEALRKVIRTHYHL